MRLSLPEIETILAIFKASDVNTKVYLFGSRVDDKQRGGDIDLLIHSAIIDKQQLRKIKWQLIERLGEQKFDLLLSEKLKEPFVKLVLPTAILLNNAIKK